MQMSGQLHIPAVLRHGEISTGIHWIGVWVGLRAGVEIVEKRIISCPCRVPNPNLSAVQPVARPYIVWAIPSPTRLKLWSNRYS
jgi:hypothetical protein